VGAHSIRETRCRDRPVAAKPRQAGTIGSRHKGRVQPRQGPPPCVHRGHLTLRAVYGACPHRTRLVQDPGCRSANRGDPTRRALGGELPAARPAGAEGGEVLRVRTNLGVDVVRAQRPHLIEADVQRGVQVTRTGQHVLDGLQPQGRSGVLHRPAARSR